MKIVSLNTKGITDPLKAKAVRAWLLSSHKDVDFLCLQEVKADPSILAQRLSSIAPDFAWMYTCHRQGSGGAAIGVAPKYIEFIEDTVSDAAQKLWVDF